MFDLHHNVSPSVALTPAKITASADGSAIDLLGANSAELLVNVGAAAVSTSTGTSLRFGIKECDTVGGSYVAADDADVLGNLGNSDGSFALINALSKYGATYKGGYKGSKRFIKLFVTVTGTYTSTTASIVAAEAILGDLLHAPAV